MKKIIFTSLVLFLLGCNSNSENSNQKIENSEIEKNVENKTEIKDQVEPKLLSVCNEITVIKSNKESSIDEIELKFENGLSVYDDNSTFSGVEWYSDDFQIRKDGKVIYDYKAKEDIRFPFRNRKTGSDLPRFVVKDNKIAYIFEQILMPNNSINKVLLFDNDKFILEKEISSNFKGTKKELELLFSDGFK